MNLVVRRSLTALALSSALACSGCAGLGGNQASQSPAFPGTAANGSYEPPVPVSIVPSGEARPEPPTGWAKFNFDHLT